MRIKLLVATAFAALTVTGTAGAKELVKIGEIAIPGEKLTSFDIGYVDQKTQRYYLADRNNKGVDIFDAKTDKYIGRVAGMVGTIMKKDGTCCNNDKSGPNGVFATPTEIWAGDGDSTLRIIDAKTMKTTDTISTGGTTRLDEMASDPKKKIWIGVNNAEDPPFATLISMKPGHKVIAKVSFADATDGAEQPGYNAADGKFYIAIPELKKDEKKGGVAVIDPTTGKVVKMLNVDNCKPNGLIFGPNQNFLLGCQANGKKVGPPILVVMNAKTGKVVANIPDIGGADEVAYSAKNGQYYSGSSNFQPGPVLGVIDAKTNKLVQKIAITGGSPHSVTVNESNGHVYLPVGTPNGGCGCIQVFALK